MYEDPKVLRFDVIEGQFDVFAFTKFENVLATDSLLLLVTLVLNVNHSPMESRSGRLVSAYGTD